MGATLIYLLLSGGPYLLPEIVLYKQTERPFASAELSLSRCRMDANCVRFHIDIRM
jgi:hypothetical protein